MGYLAAKDTGFLTMNVISSIFTGDAASPDGAFNPTDNFNVVNLNTYSLNVNISRNVDTSPNIAGNITRAAIGSKNITPITLSCIYSRRITDLSASQIIVSGIETEKYLAEWAGSKKIIMLFYMPNQDNASLLHYGQEKDFYGSQLKVLYDVMWDKNTDVSTRGFSDSLYGTYHYSVTMTVIGTYYPCAIPVVFYSFDARELGESNMVQVTVQGYALDNEGA